MSNIVKLQFKSTIPARLENALADFGFTQYARKVGSWVIYEKDLTKHKPREIDNFGVSKNVQAHLLSRLERVIDSYLDPYSHTDAIRSQCMRIANQLPKNQRAWVLDWIEKNVDAKPPWEDESYQPQLGFC